jgi:hypothetical protein
MSLYLKETYEKEIARLRFEVKQLEIKKEKLLEVNPWYPLRSINPKLGHKRRKLKIAIEKYKSWMHV